MSTPVTQNNATKMTPFWKAYWAAKSANNQQVLDACKRMLVAAKKLQPASNADWQVVSDAMAEL